MISGWYDEWWMISGEWYVMICGSVAEMKEWNVGMLCTAKEIGKV